MNKELSKPTLVASLITLVVVIGGVFYWFARGSSNIPDPNGPPPPDIQKRLKMGGPAQAGAPDAPPPDVQRQLKAMSGGG